MAYRRRRFRSFRRIGRGIRRRFRSFRMRRRSPRRPRRIGYRM